MIRHFYIFRPERERGAYCRASGGFLVPTQEVTTAFDPVLFFFFSPDAGGDYCSRPCFVFFNLHYSYGKLLNCLTHFFKTRLKWGERGIRKIALI